jgi:hypothetical protein
MRTRSFLLLAALASCGGDDDSGSAGRALQTTIRWHQKAATETVMCHPFRLDNDQAIFSDRLSIAVSKGSHHAHLYRADSAEPDTPFDCSKGMDWDKWRLVFGAQTRSVDWTLPPGVTLALAPHQQMLLQIHSMNTSELDVDPEVTVEVTRVEDSGTHLGVLFGVNKEVELEPGQERTTSQWCPLPAGATVAALMGHFHATGTDYRVLFGSRQGPDELVYHVADESTLSFAQMAPPLVAGEGDGLRFECTFFNWRDRPTTWGPDTTTQEHCNLTAYYYGGVAPASPLCLQE